MKAILFSFLFTLTFTGCSSNPPSVSTFNKARQLESSGNYSEAAKLYKQAALEGNTAAQNNLGFMYRKGKGLPRDYKQALYWYTKSANQGNAHAMNNIGTIYAHGYGVKQSYAIAEVWYRKAAKNGSTSAENSIVAMNKEKKLTQKSITNKNKTPLLSLQGYDNTDTKKDNYPVLNRRKIGKFASEIYSRFISSGKFITNDVQSTLFAASEHWALRLKGWKNDHVFSRTSQKAKLNRQPDMNYCSSLIDVLTNGVSLQPEFSKSHMKEVKRYLSIARKYPPSGLAKYNVSAKRLRLVEEYEFVWNRPAVCSCVNNPEVTQFCQKYGYQPLLMKK